MANIYDVGDLVRVSATFKRGAALDDPTTVTLKIRKGDGTSATYTYALGQVIRDSLGIFHADISLDVPGTWAYRWEGTGPTQAAGQNTFVVQPALA